MIFESTTSFSFCSISYTIIPHFLSLCEKYLCVIVYLLYHTVFIFAAKKAKKKKGKTLNLTEFLAKEGDNGSSVSHVPVFSARSTSWADESENLNTEGMFISSL